MKTSNSYSKQGFFTDICGVEEATKIKKLHSMRDGFLEYMGFELKNAGFLVDDDYAIYKVYRSPETIEKVAENMINIPITDDHINAGTKESPAPILKTDVKGKVISASVKPYSDINKMATCVIENDVFVNSKLQKMVKTGKKQLSLGYHADLKNVSDQEYQFEQYNIRPHHLALVDVGRCGGTCSFQDKNQIEEAQMPNSEKELMKESLQDIAELLPKLKEAITKAPIEKLTEILPILKELVAMIDKQQINEEKKPEGDEKQTFTDSDMKKHIDNAVKEHASVMLKARNFLDANYNFADKTTVQIMADAVKTQFGGQSFADHELAVAFKMLKKSNTYSDFGSKSADQWEELKKKEIGAN